MYSLSNGALGKLVISLRSSFWFLPVLVVLASLGLAVALVALDQQLVGLPGRRWRALFAVEADSARERMATIAGSMITVAGVVFSITIVALAQASTHGPRCCARRVRTSRACEPGCRRALNALRYVSGRIIGYRWRSAYRRVPASPMNPGP